MAPPEPGRGGIRKGSRRVNGDAVLLLASPEQWWLESNQRRYIRVKAGCVRPLRHTTMAGTGLEPVVPGYEPGVLPLHYPAMRYQDAVFPDLNRQIRDRLSIQHIGCCWRLSRGLLYMGTFLYKSTHHLVNFVTPMYGRWRSIGVAVTPLLRGCFWCYNRSGAKV